MIKGAAIFAAGAASGLVVGIALGIATALLATAQDDLEKERDLHQPKKEAQPAGDA